MFVKYNYAIIIILESLLSKFQLYIVYMGEKKHDDPSVVTASHHDTLTSVLGRYKEFKS
jgi:hypothetical protein